MLYSKKIPLKKEEESQDLIPDPLAFLHSFKEHASHYIQNAYEVEHTCHKASDGTLTTSLAEDVLSLMETQRSVLVNFLKESKLVGTAAGQTLFADGSTFLLDCLKEAQMRNRLVFLTCLEDACAAANDFFRMSERIEVLVDHLLENYASVAPKARRRLKDQSTTGESTAASAASANDDSALKQLGDSLVIQFSQDAVYAAERSHVFIVRTVQKNTPIPSNFFSKEWEIDWTHNETAIELVKVFEDYLASISRFLCNRFLFHKTLIISTRAMVCFYIRCLIHKAESICRFYRRHPGDLLLLGKQGKPFTCPKKALIRIGDDIALFLDFFERQAKGNQALTRMIRSEFLTLEVIHECLGCTNDASSLESLVVVVHKRTGADALVTKNLVGDLCLLMAQDSNRGELKDTLDDLSQDLRMVTSGMNEHRPPKANDEISFVRVDEMLRVLYEDRIAQGLLPICSTCLPKDIVADCDKSVLGRRVRSLTRNVVELKWGKNMLSPKGKKS